MSGDGYELEAFDLAPDAPSSGASVDRHVACVECSYDLIGTPVEGVCPECGLRVGRSLLDTYQLTNCSRAYLRALHRGAFIIVSLIVAWLLLIILMIGGVVSAAAGTGAGAFNALNGTVAELLAGGVNALIWLGVIYGWWLLSSEDPSYTGSDRGARARLLLRVGLVGSAAVSVGSFMFDLLRSSAAGGALDLVDSVLRLTELAMWTLAFFASMVYLRWLAPRIPDKHVLERATQLMWLGPLLMTVGLLLCGLGPIIALVLYWNLVDLVRRDLTRLMKRQDRLGMV